MVPDAMKRLLLIFFVIFGMALALGEAMVFISEPPEDVPVSPWLLLGLAFVLFLVAFSFVGCIPLKPHLNETVGWVVLALLACLAGCIGFMRLPTHDSAGVEIAIFAVYAVSGLVGAMLAFKGGTAARA